MTVYRPCGHCGRRANCEVKQRAQRAVKGQGFSLVSINCKVIAADFPPGKRVIARLNVWRDGNWGEGEYEEQDFPATVIRYARGKVRVQLDGSLPTAKGNLRYFRVWPERLKPTDEAPRRLCNCGFVVRPGGLCDLPADFTCYQDMPL